MIGRQDCWKNNKPAVPYLYVICWGTMGESAKKGARQGGEKSSPSQCGEYGGDVDSVTGRGGLRSRRSEENLTQCVLGCAETTTAVKIHKSTWEQVQEPRR